jgi:hypothetical protein
MKTNVAMAITITLFSAVLGWSQGTARNDPRVTEAARQLLLTVEKLDASFVAGANRMESQRRLVDAIAAMEDFTARGRDKTLPRFAEDANNAIKSYGEAVKVTADRNKAIASARAELQSARHFLDNYEATGREADQQKPSWYALSTPRRPSPTGSDQPSKPTSTQLTPST